MQHGISFVSPSQPPRLTARTLSHDTSLFNFRRFKYYAKLCAMYPHQLCVAVPFCPRSRPSREMILFAKTGGTGKCTFRSGAKALHSWWHQHNRTRTRTGRLASGKCCTFSRPNLEPTKLDIGSVNVHLQPHNPWNGGGLLGRCSSTQKTAE